MRESGNARKSRSPDIWRPLRRLPIAGRCAVHGVRHDECRVALTGAKRGPKPLDRVGFKCAVRWITLCPPPQTVCCPPLLFYLSHWSAVSSPACPAPCTGSYPTTTLLVRRTLPLSCHSWTLKTPPLRKLPPFGVMLRSMSREMAVQARKGVQLQIRMAQSQGPTPAPPNSQALDPSYAL